MLQDELIDLTEGSEADKARLEAEVRDLHKQLTELKARLRELEFEQVKCAPVPTLPTQQERLNSSNGSNILESPKGVEDAQEKYVHKPREKPVERSTLHRKPNNLNISNETLPSLSAEVETEASSEHSSRSQVKDKDGGHMMAAEIETDSSGDSWPDIGSQPELSEAISSGKLGELESTLERSLPRGNDDIDGTEATQPFHVTELPVTISEDSSARAKISPRVTNQNKSKGRSLLELLGGGEELDESVEVDSDDDVEEEDADEEQEANSKPAMTRDKTLKIFKQLKKAKQRSKKCLAPTPKLSKESPTQSTKGNTSKSKPNQERTDMTNKPSGDIEEQDDNDDVKHIKEDILAKSGN